MLWRFLTVSVAAATAAAAAAPSSLETFMVDFWKQTDAADALIQPLSSGGWTPCPRGGLYRAATQDCVRWFSPGCATSVANGTDAQGIIVKASATAAALRCRRRSSPSWLGGEDVNQICVAAMGDPAAVLVLNTTRAAAALREGRGGAFLCRGLRITSAGDAAAVAEGNVPAAALGSGLGAGFAALAVILAAMAARARQRGRRPPLPQVKQETVAPPPASSLAFYNLNPTTIPFERRVRSQKAERLAVEKQGFAPIRPRTPRRA
jgi:hypothetical protein